MTSQESHLKVLVYSSSLIIIAKSLVIPLSYNGADLVIIIFATLSLIATEFAVLLKAHFQDPWFVSTSRTKLIMIYNMQ